MLNQLYIFLIIALAVSKKQIKIQLFNQSRFVKKNLSFKKIDIKIDIKNLKIQIFIKNLKVVQNPFQYNIWRILDLFKQFFKNQNFVYKTSLINSSQQYVNLFITHFKTIHQNIALDPRSISIDPFTKSLIQDDA